MQEAGNEELNFGLESLLFLTLPRCILGLQITEGFDKT